MAGFPTPITADNFSSAWRYVTRKYRLAKKASKTRSLALSLGQILYFPAFLILMLGAVCTLTPRSVTSFVEKAPAAVRFWNRISGLLFAGADTLGQQLLRGAIILYGVPLAVFLVAAILIFLVYHPRALPLTGDSRKDAEALWSMARHAQNMARENEKDINGPLAIFTGIAAAAFAIGVIIYWISDPVGKELASQQGLSTNLKLFALALILIFSYNILNLPLAVVMKVMCSCSVPKRLSSAAEIYCRGVRADGAVITAPSVASNEEIAAPPTAEEVPAEKND